MGWGLGHHPLAPAKMRSICVALCGSAETPVNKDLLFTVQWTEVQGPVLWGCGGPDCWGNILPGDEGTLEGRIRRRSLGTCSPQGNLGHCLYPWKSCGIRRNGWPEWGGGRSAKPLALAGIQISVIGKSSCGGRTESRGTYLRSRRVASSWAPHLSRAGAAGPFELHLRPLHLPSSQLPACLPARLPAGRCCDCHDCHSLPPLLPRPS